MKVYRIWWRMYIHGEHVYTCVSPQIYIKKRLAERAAKERFQDCGAVRYEWIVSEDNPWS